MLSIQWNNWLELLVHLISWTYCVICVIGDKNFPDSFQIVVEGEGAATGVQTLQLLSLSSCFLPSLSIVV